MPTDDSVMRSVVLPVPPEEAWEALLLPRRETLLTVVESGFQALPAGWGPRLAAPVGTRAIA